MSHERRARDPEVVEKVAHELDMRREFVGVLARTVAPAARQEIDEYLAASVGQKGREGAPGMRRPGEPVEENDGVTGAPGPGRIVIEPGAAEVHELAAHAQC
jgi:hypothetical protein